MSCYKNWSGQEILIDPLPEAKVTEHGWPEWSFKKTYLLPLQELHSVSGSSGEDPLWHWTQRALLFLYVWAGHLWEKERMNEGKNPSVIIMDTCTSDLTCKSTSICQTKQTKLDPRFYCLFSFSLSLFLCWSFCFFPLPPSTTPIWQVQGLWMQQRSSSHDSNGLLGSLAGQSWTAGMAKILSLSLPLFIHLKPSPLAL